MTLTPAERRAADRRFYATLFLVTGPFFQAGGWIAAFTEVGAVLVFLGPAMSAAGFLLRRNRWTLAFAMAGIALGGWGWMALFIVL